MLELTPNTLLHRRYRIQRVIAGGGMGVLYAAFDEQFERTVAIKQNGEMLPAELFLSEAKLLGKLHHQHLPAALDVFEENQQQFLVMEYIEGSDLDQLLTARKKFPLNEVGPWALQILDALNYLHTREPPVIHRDIKPSNLILSRGSIFLVDFGISKDTAKTRLPGSGTRQYASPEHTSGTTTEASDLYSLSATLYHLLTGIPVPIADVRMLEIRKKGRTDPLLPAHIYDPNIGEAVSAVLAKGLSLEPWERYHSATEMRDTFAAAIQTTAPSGGLTELNETRTVAVNPEQPQPDLVQQISNWPAWLLWGIPSALVVLLVSVSALLILSLWPQNEPATAQESPPTVTPTASATAPAQSTTMPTLSPTEPFATLEPTPLPAPTATPAPPAIAAPAPLPPAPPTTIRIALQSPQSGEWAALGTGIRNAADLAVAQRSGPLARLGYTVEFVPFDDQSSEPQGRANAETIVADPAVLCVVGHFNSGVTIAAQPIYAAANLVQISPGSTNPSVTDDNDNVWRVVGRDDVQGAIAARFAREVLQSQRAYIIHDSTTYSRSIAQFFRQEADANGLEIVAFQSFDHSPKEIDFTPFLDEIQSLDPAPDLIFAPLSYTQGGVFFRQARARGIAAQFLGADSLDNPELVSLGGDAVSDMHFTTVAAPVSEFPQARQFAEDYRNTFGQEAPPFSPESYDAATICIEVIATAARASGQYPSREQVLDAMRTFPRFEGISGNYRFNPNGDPLTVGYYVVQVNTQNYSANRVVYAQAGEPPN